MFSNLDSYPFIISGGGGILNKNSVFFQVAVDTILNAMEPSCCQHPMGCKTCGMNIMWHEYKVERGIDKILMKTISNVFWL